jgi:hypothetical protein
MENGNVLLVKKSTFHVMLANMQWNTIMKQSRHAVAFFVTIATNISVLFVIEMQFKERFIKEKESVFATIVNLKQKLAMMIATILKIK